MGTLSSDQAREYSRRWQQIGRQETVELRQLGMDVKLRQLSSLIASRDFLPADPLREQSVRATRERWQRLRRTLTGG